MSITDERLRELRAEIQDARRKALEEAVGVVERFQRDWLLPWREQLTKEIRALIGKGE